MPEKFENLAQRWDRICIALVTILEQRWHKNAVVRFSVVDMATLPFDRVLETFESPGSVRFRHITPAKAQRMLADKVDTRGEPVTHTPLQGRWHKIAAVLLWKHFRDGVTLKRAAIAEPNPERVLTLEGHESEIELRFVSRAEARAIEARERFDTGMSLIERVDTGRVEQAVQQMQRPRFGPRRRR